MIDLPDNVNDDLSADQQYARKQLTACAKGRSLKQTQTRYIHASLHLRVGRQ